VRIIHRDSGARGEARDSRDQLTNKRNAFQRLLQTKEWKAWHKLECSKRMGDIAVVEAAVEAAMDERNILVEVGDGEKWVRVEDAMASI
jgi:hypothetical protein